MSMQPLKCSHGTSTYQSSVIISNDGMAGGVGFETRPAARLLVWHVQGFIVVAKMKAQSGRVNAPMTHNEHNGKDYLGAEIEDAVEDCFGIWRDNITSFADAPGDGVADPDEERPDSAGQVNTVDVYTKSFCMPATIASEDPEHTEHGCTAKSKESY